MVLVRSLPSAVGGSSSCARGRAWKEQEKSVGGDCHDNAGLAPYLEVIGVDPVISLDLTATRDFGNTFDTIDSSARAHARMWDGFTEDDIERLKGGERELKGQEQSTTVPKRQSTHVRGSGKKNLARERMLQKPNKIPYDGGGSVDIPDNARLLKPKNISSKTSEIAPTVTKNISEDKQDNVEIETKCNESECTPLTDGRKMSIDNASSQGPVCIKIKEGKNYEVLSTEKSPLDDFQSRHKFMEEQNRRRKELLAKALADRKKKTHAEARRLQQIQEELQKLDALLSNDVGILRNQIEAASFDFMDAQKRYDKAEKEFLDAKLNLFSKLERKELLTEHLCKIIEQNEMRKAKKLSELMDKLDLGATVENSEEEQKNSIGPVILPTLCALDEVSYSACNTLKNRQSDSTADLDTTMNVCENRSNSSIQNSNGSSAASVPGVQGMRTLGRGMGPEETLRPVQMEAALLAQVGGGSLEDSATL